MFLPVLTMWEYVGRAIAWLLPALEHMKKFAQAVLNINATISSKNQIASALTSLANEHVIHTHLLFLKAYHDAFLDNICKKERIYEQAYDCKVLYNE